MLSQSKDLEIKRNKVLKALLIWVTSYWISVGAWLSQSCRVRKHSPLSVGTTTDPENSRVTSQ